MCEWHSLKNIIPEPAYGYCRLMSLRVECLGVKDNCDCAEDLRAWDLLKLTL